MGEATLPSGHDDATLGACGFALSSAERLRQHSIGIRDPVLISY
jgi:hypothetical protein